jgi:hypothetical protein
VHESQRDGWSGSREPEDLYQLDPKVRTVGIVARGLKNRDPRGHAFRRSMWVGVAAALLIAALVVLATTLSWHWRSHFMPTDESSTLDEQGRAAVRALISAPGSGTMRYPMCGCSRSELNIEARQTSRR